MALVLGLLALVGAYVLWGDPTLDRRGIDEALPTKEDMPRYVVSPGIVTELSPPVGARDGRAVVTGSRLDGQCEVYTMEGDAWACEGLVGLGVVGFANESNVESRVASFVLAYSSDRAAQTAWRALVEQIRPKARGFERQTPRVGDESASFSGDVGSIVALRSGSVVALVTSRFESGYLTDPQAPVSLRDPIEMWAALQADKIAKAL